MEEDELIFKEEDSPQVDKILERLKNIQRYAHALSAIESISDFEPIINKSKNAESADYIVKLIDFQNYEQNKVKLLETTLKE